MLVSILSVFLLLLHKCYGLQGVTDDELRTFSDAVFKKDNTNGSLVVVVKTQAQTRPYSATDQAPLPLLDVSPQVKQVLTVQKLMALYDNYIPDTTQSELITPQERTEESDFMEAVLGTPIWDYTINFLKSKGFITGSSKKEVKELLTKIWFTVYSRGNRKLGSSAFEHIFLGEIKRGEVSGMHNWLFFSHEEQNKHANYLGYMRIADFNGKGGIIKLHYTWHGQNKPVGTLFVGTSPELELALYTVCYYARPNDKCFMKLNGKDMYIQTYTFNSNNQKLIGSAFPSLL